jgi:hypothetical protein
LLAGTPAAAASPPFLSPCQAYTVLNNVPGSDAVSDENPQARLVIHGVHLLGIFFFAVLLGACSAASPPLGPSSGAS